MENSSTTEIVPVIASDRDHAAALMKSRNGWSVLGEEAAQGLLDTGQTVQAFAKYREALTEAASQPREGEENWADKAAARMAKIASIPESMIDAALSAIVPGGAPVSAWLPQKDPWTPHQTARDVIRYALHAALTQRPPEQAGAVDVLDNAWTPYGKRSLYNLTDLLGIADQKPTVVSVINRAYDEIVFLRALSPAPTPPDAGPGEIPAGMIERDASGSFACPICGEEKPHHHTAPVVDGYQKKGSRFAPMQCLKCGVGGGSHDGLCPDATILTLGVREAGAASTPKAPPQTPPDAGIGSDGAGEIERLRKALANTTAIVRLQNGNLQADINEILAQADAALATQPGGGGRS